MSGEDTQRVTEWHGFKLSPFQVRAINAIREGRNVLVSAPTGAGKTLVAEYAIEDAVRRGKRSVYTAPIKALSNQKFRDFRAELDVEVGLQTGDVTLHPRAQVLVMTTEILRNSVFENAGQLADIEYVVFDEVHFMDDAERGTVWEECLIFLPPSIRLICLSATISNLDELGSWIREIRPQELTTVHSGDRPVPLKIDLWTPGVGRFGRSELASVVDRAQHGGGRKKSHGRGSIRPGPPDERGLLDELQRDRHLPAMVFSFSRRDCERLASKNQRRELLEPEELARMEALQAELLQIYGLDEGELRGEVFSLARRGIGYHHAGMLPIHKELVERMFTAGLLKLLFTTETFALGINMPARTVVFNGLRKFDGVNFDYVRTREFQQMAGRAGRQGIDTEGHVTCLLGKRDLELEPLRRILWGKSEPVRSRFALTYSTILHLTENLGREGVFEAWGKSFNQFQHRGRGRRARERNEKAQQRVVEAHLGFLRELGYLEDDDRLSPRGRLARLLYGFEIQITEMVFRGTLEDLPPRAIAMVFVALVYEERRRGIDVRVPQRLFGGVRRHVSDQLGRLARKELEFSVPSPMKVPDWGLTQAVLAWAEGASFEELEDITGIPPGDTCRTMRMAVQLLRQLRRALGPEWPLSEGLGDAMEAINRDEVDARRQLELG